VAIEDYKTFIFDFDGVILNSNLIKKAAIKEAASDVLSIKKTKEFVEYFIHFNGVPREKKIAKYICEDEYEYVLNKYESLIDLELKKAEIIPGVVDIIKKISKLKKTIIVLSGGTQDEVYKLLEYKKLAHYFDGVYGGPKNKEENLQELSLNKPVLYFGDSEVDYLVSKKYNFDFIFIYGYSSIVNWKMKVNNWDLVKSIKDFKEGI
jgi:HAD superfamily hydrolase (TIGR01549 family)